MEIREKYITESVLPVKEWDLLIIGGGATGIGIALDAVSRGYTCLIVEQSDFAKGTSSRSTKLVHGGVRYLAQGDIKLVREASIERGLLHKNAPHLVRNQTFIVPIYSFWERLKYTTGLKIYDKIAGRLSLGPSKFISRKETIEKLPGVKTKGLYGGVLYHDGQFDDSRLAINVVQTIQEQGGHALNYMHVNGLLKNDAGKITGVAVTDTETGIGYTFYAKAVVNATGVFVDDILHMDNPDSKKTIRVSQGVHLVIDKSFYSGDVALMIPKTSDGRVLFAVPWHNKVILGTTDTPVKSASLEPKALEEEVDFILKTSYGFLEKKPTRKDILSVFAGLRPLAVPKNDDNKTKEISRSHKVVVSPSGLFTLLGGKWTTFRKMGEDLVDKVEETLHWDKTRSASANVQIHGHVSNVDWSNPFYFYGSDAPLLYNSMNGNKNNWLSETLKIHEAQIIWAVKNEMACTVEDVLARRTRALFLDAAESVRIAPRVAAIMAKLLHKTESWQAEQVAAFNKVAQSYLLPH